MVPALTRVAEDMENAAQSGGVLAGILAGLFGAETGIQRHGATDSRISRSRSRSKTLRKKLANFRARLTGRRKAGGRIINDLVFGKPGEFDQQIAVAKTRSKHSKKFGKDRRQTGRRSRQETAV